MCGTLPPEARDTAHWDISQLTSLSSFINSHMIQACVQNAPPEMTVGWTPAMLTTLTLQAPIRVDDWDTQNIVTARHAFSLCVQMTLDVSRWRMPNLTDATSMFAHCRAFNSNMNDWNPVKLAIAENMFYGCVSLNQPFDQWPTRQFVRTNEMFSGCTSLHQDFSSWILPLGATVGDMFADTPIERSAGVVIGRRQLTAPALDLHPASVIHRGVAPHRVPHTFVNIHPAPRRVRSGDWRPRVGHDALRVSSNWVADVLRGIAAHPAGTDDDAMECVFALFLRRTQPAGITMPQCAALQHMLRTITRAHMSVWWHKHQFYPDAVVPRLIRSHRPWRSNAGAMTPHHSSITANPFLYAVHMEPAFGQWYPVITIPKGTLLFTARDRRSPDVVASMMHLFKMASGHTSFVDLMQGLEDTLTYFYPIPTMNQVVSPTFDTMNEVVLTQDVRLLCLVGPSPLARFMKSSRSQQEVLDRSDAPNYRPAFAPEPWSAIAPYPIHPMPGNPFDRIMPRQLTMELQLNGLISIANADSMTTNFKALANEFQHNILDTAFYRACALNGVSHTADTSDQIGDAVPASIDPDSFTAFSLGSRLVGIPEIVLFPCNIHRRGAAAQYAALQAEFAPHIARATALPPPGTRRGAPSTAAITAVEDNLVRDLNQRLGSVLATFGAAPEGSAPNPLAGAARELFVFANVAEVYGYESVELANNMALLLRSQHFCKSRQAYPLLNVLPDAMDPETRAVLCHDFEAAGGLEPSSNFMLGALHSMFPDSPEVQRLPPSWCALDLVNMYVQMDRAVEAMNRSARPLPRPTAPTTRPPNGADADSAAWTHTGDLLSQSIMEPQFVETSLPPDPVPPALPPPSSMHGGAVVAPIAAVPDDLGATAEPADAYTSAANLVAKPGDETLPDAADLDVSPPTLEPSSGPMVPAWTDADVQLLSRLPPVRPDAATIEAPWVSADRSRCYIEVRGMPIYIQGQGPGASP